jgi:hypothetical protein
MKQAEVPKSREGIKQKLNSGFDISDDPGTMFVGVCRETKPDVDKEEGFEDTTKDTAEVDKDMVKQDKAFFNREEVPEARTGSTRKSSSRHPKNWRLKELILMLMLLHLQVGNHNEVAEVMKKNNSREIKVHQGRELIKYGKLEMRAVIADITDAVSSFTFGSFLAVSILSVSLLFVTALSFSTSSLFLTWTKKYQNKTPSIDSNVPVSESFSSIFNQNENVMGDVFMEVSVIEMSMDIEGMEVIQVEYIDADNTDSGQPRLLEEQFVDLGYSEVSADTFVNAEQNKIANSDTTSDNNPRTHSVEPETETDLSNKESVPVTENFHLI